MSFTVFSLLFCLSLAGAVFFAGTETGILAADTIWFRRRMNRGSKRARKVMVMLQRKDALLATMLVGNNLAIVSASAVATSFFTQHFGPHGAVLSIVVVSPLLLVFGEILPKAFYLSYGNRILLATHWLITVFAIVFKPVVMVTMVLPKILTRGRKKRTGDVTRQDIEVLVKTSVLAGDLAREERLMISRMLNLKDRRVTEAMVPLLEVAMIPDTASVRDAYCIIRTRGVSRLPVYHEKNDHVTGVVFATDLLRSNDPAQPITDFVRKPYFVPEQKTIIELFEEFYRKLEIAIVVDEYGVAAGIITMEDMVEEVIGDVQDEYDDEISLCQELDTGGLLFDSRISVTDFNEQFGKIAPPGDYKTMAGFLMTYMQRVPRRGEQITFSGTRFTILDATPQRIGRVVAKKCAKKGDKNVGK